MTCAALEQGKRVCLYSPTGGGKTSQAIELFRWAYHQHLGGAAAFPHVYCLEGNDDRGILGKIWCHG
jgi:hypothetical protein